MKFLSLTARRARDLRAGILPTCFWLAALGAGAALADGIPQPGQIGLQEAVTPIAEEMHFFHNWVLLPIIIGISVFVLGLLAYVIVRFNERANPTPSRTTHNSTLEVIWTVVPVMILVVIAIPSFRLLTHQVVMPQADVTVKVTAKQWYWTYNYPADQGGGFEFDSYMVPEDSLKPGDIRLLSVDNEAVVPVGKVVRIQVTAADVIHSFTVPAFGIRIDAIPGRLNETWFKAEREGIYYGQCSKLCGQDHAYMPIAVRVVSEENYATWLAEAAKKFASSGAAPVNLAANASQDLERR
ncbi:cytochrome c oxidase subunit II [Methylocapsa acidiphila]|uniref:cytochrome c oxidase subunit II n=1 Tax=Methylocapsa acidiphila TaxID=133552 RepID=UPI000409885E|nr:cytochrome c oxidase subunit II [Methylocapsa acidiphila]